MQEVFVVVAVLVAAVSASGTYNGKYPGKCGADGFYDSDDYSFVICSNGNAYKQPCSPGSKNSGSYTHGKYYVSHPFCDVNLVDEGYAVRHGGYGHGHGHNNHGHNNYGHGNFGYGHNQAHGHNTHGYGGKHAHTGYEHRYQSGYEHNSYGNRDHGHKRH